jgi:hypothetical protein
VLFADGSGKWRDASGRRPLWSIRRVARVVAAILVIAAPNANPVGAAYWGGCVDAGYYDNYKYINLRDNLGPYGGVIMELTARHLRACSAQQYGGDWYGGVTYVPNTLQYSYADRDKIVQIGIGMCTWPDGCGGDEADGNGAIPADGQVHFWYTKYDSHGGQVYLADGWFGAAPVLTHRYRLKIEGGDVWTYSIRDVTAGGSYVSHTRAKHWSGADIVWWGGEVWNRNDAMGNPYPLHDDLNIWSLYRTGGNWYETNGDDQVCLKSTYYGSPFPNYYTCSYTTVTNPKDRQRVRTTDH